MNHSNQPTLAQRQLEEILFAAALKLPPSERAAFLEAACKGDGILQRRLDALLSIHEQPDALPEPPSEVASSKIIPKAPAPDEFIGTRVGRYKLLEKIGEGGCGVVYVAEQTEPVRRRVALKLIKPGMDTKAVIARFEAERQALALMDHPNIAKVLDCGATDAGRPYFVMELVRGRKITEHSDFHKLSTEERIKLFVQVCHAVQHAHQKGIIHRDLKPSNVFVTSHDGVAVPKVIDFGIAKAISDQPLTDKTVYTAMDQFLGTPAYMSPEQAARSGLEPDTRSDIYSLGVLLYELLTGHPPFESKALMEAGHEHMLKIIREQEPPRPSERLSTMNAAEATAVAQARRSEPPRLFHAVRGDLDWIAMKCLEKDRARRYESAKGLAEDVQRHLANEPIIARPPSAAYRFEKLVRRHRFAFISSGVIILSVICGGVLEHWKSTHRRPATNIVVNSADHGDGSFRQAILDATNDATITFATNLSGQTILLTSSDIAIRRNVSVSADSLPKGIYIDGNQAGRIFDIGQGATVFLGRLTLTNCYCDSAGGAIINRGNLTLSACTLAGNRANNDGGGGAIFNSEGGNIAINGCTLSGNVTPQEGGAVLNSAGAVLEVAQSTLSGNSAGRGGGICNKGVLKVRGSIVAGNLGTNIVGSYTGEYNLVDGDPMLAPLGDYGGPVLTMLPLPSSPAIDAGSDDAVAFRFALDQRGSRRLVGLRVDIGAVELCADDLARLKGVLPFSVASRFGRGGATRVVLNASNGQAGSLRDTVLNAQDGDTITFATNLSGRTIVLLSGDILIDKSLTIDGSALDKSITLSGGGKLRVFAVSAKDVSLIGLTIAHTIAPVGGAVYTLRDSSVTLKNCTLMDNSADEGGAIFSLGPLHLIQCTLAGNRGKYGGALQCRAPTTVSHCTISGNEAECGGGVCNKYSSLNLENSIVAGNSSAANGRDIFNEQAVLSYSGSNLVSFVMDDRPAAPTVGAKPLTAPPLLAALGDHGGPIQTMPPLPGSPAIDAGDDSVTNRSATDQRGKPRRVGARVDIGAVEAQ